MASTEVKLRFLSSLEHFWPDPWDTLSKTSLFFEKMHKVFKNKAQGCSTPLNFAKCSYACTKMFPFLKCDRSKQQFCATFGALYFTFEQRWLIFQKIIKKNIWAEIANFFAKKLWKKKELRLLTVTSHLLMGQGIFVSSRILSCVCKFATYFISLKHWFSSSLQNMKFWNICTLNNIQERMIVLPFTWFRAYSLI